ncbi:hypothetical protein CVO77_00380 [Sphingopyxis lindanitolerans]|uniref:Uncharacterized protein n=1 Tax=Sphingopyxis lindanitolerans TaxID=2054227 RepID=A0A2S8BB21_9SPHN|nr:hypothetical protein [Sphingopyxis lindanitolerans]PQM29429.1 hypothetical protein CVO77_00380 [Sphingopyxis lindanitolerans]
MSGAHTDGAWHVEDPMGDGVEDDLWIVVGDQAHNWRCLALVSCDVEKGPVPKPVYRPQRDANARLITAAPDLLAALLEAHRALNFYEWYNNPASGWASEDNTTVRGVVDAAIAKATGGAA